MNVSGLISVAGIVVGAVVAFAVAYLHRKQLRQIEIYRQNPVAGLIPPPHPLTAFLKSYWSTLAVVGGPLVSLVAGLSSNKPVSRFDVFTISLSTVMLVAGLFLTRLEVTVSRASLSLTRQLSAVEKALEKPEVTSQGGTRAGPLSTPNRTD